MLVHALISLATCVPHPQEEAAPGAGQAPREPFGRWIGTLPDLHEPGGVVVDAQGHILVVETVGGRVRVFERGGAELRSFGAGELLEPVGIAVTPGGDVFVSDAGHHRVVRFDAAGKLAASFGGWGAADGQFNEPRGLTLDGERLVVCDTRNHRLQVFDAAGAHLATWGGFGREPGQFERPASVTADGAGHLFVADTGNHRVQKLTRDGAPVATWGDFGPYPGFFDEPSSVAWSGGSLYVADRSNHRIQVFSPEGKLAYDFGIHALLPREGDGRIHYPEVLALAPDGSFLALAESFEDRVQLFERWPEGGVPPVDPLRFERDQSAHYGASVSTAGGFMALVEPGAPSLILWDLELPEPIQVCRLRTWGERTGQFRRPAAAVIDPLREFVHVSDPSNRRIATLGYRSRGEDEPLKYDPFLIRLVRSLDLAVLAELRPDFSARPIEPEALEVDESGRLFAADVSQRAVFLFTLGLEPAGRIEGGPRPLGRPVDLEWDSKARRLLVVDQLERCLRVFDLSGETPREVASIGSAADELGGLLRPAGVVRLADGRIWVSDEGRHRIAEFDAEGRFKRTFGGPGVGRVQFHKPRGLDQDDRGRVFVLDWGNHRGILLDDAGAYLDAFGARFFTKEARLGR